MNTKTLLFLALILGVCLCGRMSYNFQKANYKQDSNGRYQIRIPLNGGYAPYTFQYSGLPVGWDYLSDGTIFIPRSQFSSPGSYPIRCSIRDSLNQETKTSIIIVVTSNTIEVEDREYDFDYDFTGLRRGSSSLSTSTGLSISGSSSGFSSSSSSSGSSSSSKSTDIGDLNEFLAKYGVKGSNQLSSIKASSFGSSGGATLISSAGGSLSSSSLGGLSSSGILLSGSSSSGSSSSGSSSSGSSSSGSSSSGISRSSSQQSSSSISRSGSSSVISRSSSSSIGNSGIISVSRKIYDSVESLPSSRELDRIIGSADIVQITKTIQQVVSSNVRCTQQISYLNNFLGRIRSAVEMKKFQAKQLRAIIESARSAIAKLNIELESYITKQKSIGLQQQKALLTKTVRSLELAYQQFNSATANRKDLTVKLQRVQATIVVITEETNTAQRTLRVDQTSLSQTDEIIRDLQAKLTQARARRAETQKRIEASKQIINQNERKITTTRQQISQIQISISNLDATLEKARRQYLQLESEVQQIKVQVSRIESSRSNIEDSISKLRIQIESRRTKIDTTELNRVEEMVTVLTGALPKIQQTVDKINLECRGVSEFIISTSTTGPSIVRYEVSSNSFLNYIRNAYGFNNNLRFGSNTIYLSPVSIFSDDWESFYGIPFNATESRINSNIFAFDDDFTCSEGGSGLSGSILNISGNSIRVKGDDDYDYDLILGSCSRIEAAKERDYLPKRGDHIYWKGETLPGISRKYRVSAATCY